VALATAALATITSRSTSSTEDLRAGTIHIEGDHAAVTELILKRNIPFPGYSNGDMAERLRQQPGLHRLPFSSDPAVSYRGLDLSTCDGIKTGARSAGARALRRRRDPVGNPPPPAQ
jgi:hypothetical protein